MAHHGGRCVLSRRTLEERVLRRAREGLLALHLAQSFAAEVRRLAALHAAEAQARASDLGPALAELDRKIDAIVDLMEDDPRPALIERLAQREAERDEVRARIKAQLEAAPKPILLPDDLAPVYEAQLHRLNALLAGPKHVVETNDLLRELLAAVVVQPDLEAPDGLAVQLQGDLSWVPIGD